MHQALTARPAAAHPELERSAYNAAFYELGLGWHWSPDVFESLQTQADPCERIRTYMEQQHPHLLRAYDAEFLAQAIEARRATLQARDARQAAMPPRHAAVETKVAQTGF